jgi:hypothetical protein
MGVVERGSLRSRGRVSFSIYAPFVPKRHVLHPELRFLQKSSSPETDISNTFPAKDIGDNVPPIRTAGPESDGEVYTSQQVLYQQSEDDT